MASQDADAFTVTYDRYAPRALGLIVHILGRREGAEEVLQDVFWRVWNNASTYDASRGSVDAWILLMARSMAIDTLRKQARDQARLDAARLITVETTEQDTPIADQDDDERRAAQKAFDQLPTEQREVIGLAFYRGLTHAQIARLQSLPLGTVKTRVRNGMMTLREHMTKYSRKARTP